jgi:peptidoglycan hydrolase CwlO-like protein
VKTWFQSFWFQMGPNLYRYKKVSDNEKKLSGNLGEYDGDMGTIEKQLQEEKGLYDVAKKQLTEYETHYNALRKEKEEAEAIKREREEAKSKEDAMNKMLDDAALSIQKAWKTHKESTEKPAPKGKKQK